MKLTPTPPPAIGLCDNNYHSINTGGLVPKGQKCANKATVIMEYVETLNPWDGQPNTYEYAKLCADCFKYARGFVQFARRERTRKRGEAEGSAWVRRVKKVAPEKVQMKHVVAWCKSYKAVPKPLLDHFGLDIDGSPRSAETERREALTRQFWSILAG